MKEYIDRLRTIKKDELSEREFYEAVLTIIKDMENVSLTPESAAELKSALLEIGCQRYDDWKAGKEANGERVQSNNVGDGIHKGDIGTAVNFVSQLLEDYSNASFSLPYMLDGGEQYGWVQQWLSRSKELSEKENATSNVTSQIFSELKTINKAELNERTFYEKVLTFIKGMEDIKLTPEIAEELKANLLQIGCKTYDEWKAEKEKNGEYVRTPNVGRGIDEADIGTAVNFVDQLLGSYSNASFSLPYMLDGGEKHGWIQQWLRNSEEKSKDMINIPYYRVAKEAMMNWNGYSEEKATEFVTTAPFEKIEGQVWAKSSMDSAIEAIAAAVAMTDEDKRSFSDAVYGKADTDILKAIKPEIERIGADPNAIIMDTLFKVHDGWVKDNSKKFMARDKKHQHMPSELIGWKEAKADLLFIKPIFEAANIEVDETALEAEYNKRVKDFFLNRGIRTSGDLAYMIAQGPEFYPPLQGYGEVLETIKNPEYVIENVIPAIETKGIGKIEDVREGIVQQIMEEPRQEDISRLSKTEMERVEQHISKQVDDLSAEKSTLNEKNTIIGRIMQKAKERLALNKAIEIEHAKKQKNIDEYKD